MFKKTYLGRNGIQIGISPPGLDLLSENNVVVK